MPLVIPPGFAHIAIEMRHDNDPEPWYVTFGVDSTEAAGDPDAIANAAMHAFWTGFDLTISPDVHLSGCQVVVGQDGAEPVRAFVTPSAPYVGAAGGNRLPQNCALLVRKNSALGGRRNRGRMFIPGILDEDVVSATGVISPAAVTTYAGYADAFFNELADDVNQGPAIPMFILHSTGISATPDPTEVSNCSVDNVISTQRRRLR